MGGMHPAGTESLAPELERRTELAPVLGAITALGEPYAGVYLVGGIVRDLLLDARSVDLDIAVEGGDAIAFARALAGSLGGRMTAHGAFGTASVRHGEGGRVDVVTARREFYRAPGVLPAVEPASIREDLLRRDFTVNAMAVSLKAADLGRLVDPFGGRADLAAGTIRVLHDASFADDPTRIFRAVRYESRYGFRIDEHTAALANNSIELGLVGDLSPARLRDELLALLREETVRHSVERLAELGVLGAVHPGVRADGETLALLERIAELGSTCAPEAPTWRLRLEALVHRVPSEELPGWLGRLKLQRRDAEQIAGAVAVAPGLVERLGAGGLEPAEIVALAEPYAPDAPLLALAIAELEPLRAYFGRLRSVRLEVTGADLAELGLGESPRVGEILGELRRRKLNGAIDGRASELAAARVLIDAP